MNLLKQITCLLFLLLLFSCQSGDSSGNITQLEQSIATNPTTEAMQQLIDLYKVELEKTGIDAAAKAMITNKLAQLQLKNNQIKASVETLKSGIDNYLDAPSTAGNVWMLAQIFQNNMSKQDVARTLYKIYQQKYPSGTDIATAKQILAQDTTTLVGHLGNLGSKMYNEKTHRLDARMAMNFIESCELFGMLNPQDSITPDYLHKAGETARAIRAFPQAISLYSKIYTDYPTFEKAPQALFLRAFTYDNDLKNFDEARKLYTEFLKKYPEDDFADDTQFLLNNLGKTDEEIIQSFGGNEGE